MRVCAYLSKVTSKHKTLVAQRKAKNRRYQSALFIQLHFKNALRRMFGRGPRSNRALMRQFDNNRERRIEAQNVSFKKAMHAIKFISDPKGRIAQFTKEKCQQLFLNTVRKVITQKTLIDKVYRWKDTMIRIEIWLTQAINRRRRKKEMMLIYWEQITERLKLQV